MKRIYGTSSLMFYAALLLIIAVAAPAGDYIGSEQCSMCHSDTHDSWSGTSHANSLQVLKDAGVADNDECLACHTTGMGTDAYEEAVSCEGCHGAGSEHFSSGGGPGTINLEVDETTCTNCHTPDWSADWNYEEYLKTGTHE